MAMTCSVKDHRRWPCHYDEGHGGDHAFTDADEMRHMREKLAAIQARLESGKSYRMAEDIRTILDGEVPVEVNPNAGLEAWAERYMAERGIEPTPEGQTLADMIERGEA